MFSNYLSSIKGVSIYPIISLVLFFVFFIVVVMRIFMMDKKVVRQMENIPLNDDNGELTTNLENNNE